MILSSGNSNTAVQNYLSPEKIIPPLFLGLFFFIFVLLNILVGYFLVDFYSLFAVAALIITEMLNILIAYRLSEFIVSVLFQATPLPRLENLSGYPRVAILYMTYNDVMPEVLDRIRNLDYPDYKVFVLDDSTSGACRDVIDAQGYQVVRRSHRKGFKAGAINHWLSLYGKDFPYFLILDSDSIVDQDFIGEILRYAEHPDNTRIAVFQSKWRIWNTKNRFPRLVASLYPIWFFSFERLANAYSTPLIMGHNNLLRTDAIREVGGFDEDYVCEDLAISLKLLEQGYEVKYVDLVTFESCPETAAAYAKRNIRWGNGTIEVARKGTRKIPYIGNFHLFMTTFSYLIYLVYLPGMFVVTWGFTSSFGDAALLLYLILTGKILLMPVFIPLLLIFVYVFIFYFLRLPLALKLHVSLKDYFLGLLVIPAVDFYMLIPMIYGMLKTIGGEKVHFNVTSKEILTPSLLRVFRTMGIMTLIWVLLIIGVLRNPVSFIFNFFWLIPFIGTPFIIYWIEKNPVPGS